MTKPKPLLAELALRGKPLAEVVVIPFNDDEYKEIVKLLNALCPDIDAEYLPAYFQAEGKSLHYQIRFESTREALLREFGWKMERVKIYDTKEDDGKYPDGYAWQEMNEPEFYPPPLKGKIKMMGLTQPGNSDNGKQDNVEYEI